MLRLFLGQVDPVLDAATCGSRLGEPKGRRLIRQVAEIHEAERPSWSKSGVLRRDGHHCGYRLAPAKTVDHIQPRSRGGRNTWKNTVSACYSCNQRKADLTLAEAGMDLLLRPQVPTWSSTVQRRRSPPARPRLAGPFRDGAIWQHVRFWIGRLEVRALLSERNALVAQRQEARS